MQANPVFGQGLIIDENSGNAAGGDLVLGYLDDPTDRTAPLNFSDPFKFNTVQVSLRRDDSQNPTILLNFARVFGRSSATLGVTATATAQDGVVGFEINDAGGTANCAADCSARDPLDRPDHAGRQPAATTTTRTIRRRTRSTPGPDGLPELNIYPGSGVDQLTPGNFGTVDIGFV